MDIGYYIKRLFKMNYKAMFETIDKVNKRSRKNKIFIFFDMIISSIRYGAGYVDYFLFNFENLNHKQRKTYITRTINNNYLKKLNNNKYYYIFSNKANFSSKFKDYTKRKFLNLDTATKDEFKKFVTENPVFIVKPISSTGGNGVEKISVTNKMNINKLYTKLIKNNQKLVEEYIIQHPQMSKLCAVSVNTLRIVTVRKDNKTTIMLRVIRIGNGINIVDNFHKDGMYTFFDNQGVITKPAINRKGEIFEFHPITKTKFVGFEIPYYKEAIDLVIKASEVVEGIGLVGWDIAILKNGPVLVEANELPGYDLYQSKIHLIDGQNGLKPFFDKVIYGKDKND